MRINGISFTSNNRTVKQLKNKMTLPEKIGLFQNMKDACLVTVFLSSGFSFLNNGELFTAPKSKFLRWGVFGLALAGFTGMVLECINKHKYYKETGKVFNA